MNIMILINSFRLGGAEKICYDIAENLLKIKDNHVILCSIGKIETDLEKEMSVRMKNKGIQCISLEKRPKRDRLKIIFKLKKVIQEHEIDILHTNGQSPDFYARVAKGLSKTPYIVVTIHSTSGYSKNVEMFLGHSTNHYTAVSKEALAYAKNELGIRKKIRLIENGIDCEKYDIGKHDPRFTILTVGRIAEQKGYYEAVAYLMPFLKKHSDVIWKIYGDTSEHSNVYEKLKQILEQNGLEDQVKFMGVQADPTKIYKGAQAFILCSQYEGFGIAYIEAIAAGLPVFGRKVGVVPDLLNENAVIFDTDDKTTINILEKIYNGRYDLSFLDINRTLVYKKYDVHSIASQYNELFMEIVKSDGK